MFLVFVELEFSVGWLASELRQRIESDLMPELSVQPGFVSYQVVETQDNRLATVRVFNDFDSLEAANKATEAIQDTIIQEFGITAGTPFAGDVTASA
jgi:hypothetical protein